MVVLRLSASPAPSLLWLGLGLGSAFGLGFWLPFPRIMAGFALIWLDFGSILVWLDLDLAGFWLGFPTFARFYYDCFLILASQRRS